ncbi:asparagine synthase (glutamine-hydrolyzing) (plasmid) [Rhizobium leguminosarum]|uniref:asparagine synthase (glutamine-hydrolyzing) n=1 Tax=Rhizobium leguminosarum TaxID=384 RepID=UPI00048610D7|nr:asparagine synthase (glutamine-hydrolyzing) [Rhizobium leguminosarum]UIK01242.1 asparagine synthase (glutamine-hydrolyzing) [Rhizobium leguminosarum]UIL30288.1 asparagine synthase (glutamine-hydrolyzing) [Rhizobium leguminosarum]WFT90937.1 asparagine synthase (glutamine-hydrolyzing) [Rhizobium leguminosarum]
MCGITGWVSFHKDLTQHQNILDDMTRTQYLRGPDAGGTWVARHAGLGHRRLSIIDLEGGKQPMSTSNGDGDVVLTYSGEAYNFAALRNELIARGHRFATRSDTEVVLRGYLEWGAGVAERLNGMFAFALWDARVEKLVMIRDRMGIKPLYYYETDDGAIFGSEPKAILANPHAVKAVDLAGLRELLSFTQTPGTSVWYGVKEVLPGCIVTLDRNGLRERRYWSLAAKEHTDDRQTTIDTVRHLLGDTVNGQLVADVDRCVLLSGGLDSSAITALSAAHLRESGEQVRSFAVDFVGQTENFVADDIYGTPDAPYALEVSQHVRSLHQTILVDHAAMADRDIRRKVIEARDSPLSLGDKDTSLYLLFQSIRQHSTVALSGEAADEVFGGYAWMHQPQVQTADTYPWMAVFLTGAKAQVSDRLNKDLSAALDLRSFIGDSYASAVAEVSHLEGVTDHEKRMRVIMYLHLTRFVRMLLERKDRISMAVGLEVRVPFCDHRLVEYVYNTPWSLKTFDGKEKSLLRAATADILPDSVLKRVKSPYPSTQSPAYARLLMEQARDLVHSGDPVLDLIDRKWLTDITTRPVEQMDMAERNGIERALDFSAWLDIYKPELRLA